MSAAIEAGGPLLALTLAGLSPAIGHAAAAAAAFDLSSGDPRA